jgi:hypothetical protein
MNRQRLEALLAAYGSSESAWPREEREAARALLASDPRAREQLRAARELDLVLDSYRPELPDLSARILEAVAATPLQRVLAWVFPAGPQALLRPALAGLAPLVLGVALGLALPAGSDPGIADWETQERNLITPAAGEVWYE